MRRNRKQCHKLEGERMKVSDMDELVFLWKEYGKARNKSLNVGAQDLKRQVRKFVQSLPAFYEKVNPK